MGNNLKLDALRGMASLVVLLAHVVQTFSLPIPYTEHAARQAVIVFFLLSGYLITGSLAANVARNGSLDVQAYVRARFLRIYPPLLGSIALVLACVWVAQALSLNAPRLTVSWYTVKSMLWMGNAAQQANGPLWSLGIEVRLYVAALLVSLAVTTRWRWVFAAAALLWMERDYRMFDLYVLCAATWAMGAAARMLVGRKLLLALGGIALSGAYLSADDAAQLAACLVYAWLIFVRPEGSSPRAWMVATATYSYSLYITHFPLLLLATAVSPSPLMAASMAPACIAFSYWFAKWFEDHARWATATEPGPQHTASAPRHRRCR
jgi:peptidoglycan/LPS O-acetylase OafA/YrhL